MQEINCERCHQFPCHDECDMEEEKSYNATLNSEKKILDLKNLSHMSLLSIADAILNLRSIKQTLLSNKLSWTEPHISPSPEGEVVFEWWKSGKKITIYFSEDQIECYLIPLEGMIDEIIMNNSSDIIEIFTWLCHPYHNEYINKNQ